CASPDVVHASLVFFFFSSRRRHTRWPRDWSSDVCSSDLVLGELEQDRAALSGAEPLLDVFGDFDAETARTLLAKFGLGAADVFRSEERRVGKECRSGGGRACGRKR